MKNESSSKKPLYGDKVDVICTNYTECYFPEYHEKWPQKALLSTEAYHYWRRKHPNETNMVPKQGHKSYTEQNPWYQIIPRDYAAGMYLWVGIEYWGETRDPYPYHGRTNAPLRITGFKKPQSHFLESIWLDKPVVRLAVFDEEADIPRGKIHFDYPKIVCHWDFDEHPNVISGDSIFSIVTYTNCESIELLLNGKLLGKKNCVNFPNNDMKWDIYYEPGELIAIGKNNGKEVTRDVLKSASKPIKVKLTADSTQITADGQDCVHIEAEIVDENQTLVQHGEHQLTFNVEGEGKIIGIDSGDLACHDSYKSNTCKTYWGQALLIIQSTKKMGKIKINVSSLGLEGEDLEILTKN